MEECNVNVLVPYVTWWIDDPERLDCHLHTWHQHLNWKNGSGMLGQGWQLSRVCDLVKKTLKRHTVLEQTAIECPPSRSLIAIAIDCNCFLSLREHKKRLGGRFSSITYFECIHVNHILTCIDVLFIVQTRAKMHTHVYRIKRRHTHTHTDTHTPTRPKKNTCIGTTCWQIVSRNRSNIEAMFTVWVGPPRSEWD
jgi:hypothetical protein